MAIAFVPDQRNMPNSSNLPLLSANLVATGVSLRGETEEDRPFLEQLFISTRWEETGATGWSEDVRLAFLRQQFQAQTYHYHTHYYDAEYGVIEVRGEQAGRLYIHRSSKELRIVDISLLPQYRGTGIGGAVIRGLQEEAAEHGRIVSIHVEKFNPALNLYRRLGFIETGENGPYWRMDWTPTTVLKEQQAS
jgi:ribosomal protein S18 acetylase RimI-like enzyme